MNTNENSVPVKKSLDDTTKLAILETVETEVQKRIRRQEWYYWLILLISALSVYWYARTFWNTEMSEIPNVVRKQLEAEGALAIQKELTNDLANAQVLTFKLNSVFNSTKLQADEINTNLNDLAKRVKSTADNIDAALNQIPASINTNVIVPFGNRLEQLKQQDNILLVDDLPKLFVRELVTNLVENNTIVLNYEPIPSTVKIYCYNIPNSVFWRFYPLDQCGYCQRTSIVFTNLSPTFTAQVINHIQTDGIVIEYLRKSLR